MRNWAPSGSYFQISSQTGKTFNLFRQTNSIKNRFYTALRNTFKILFKEHKNIPKKLPHEIPSRDLVRLY